MISMKINNESFFFIKFQKLLFKRRKSKGMQIFLKMTPSDPIQSELELKLNYFAVSQACGYSFQTFDEKIQQNTLNSKQKELQEILNKIVDSYQGHRIDEAYKYRQQYLHLSKQINAITKQEHQQLMDTIKEEMEDVWQYEKQLHSSGWVHKKDGTFYKIYTKHFHQTVAVLVEAEIKTPIEKFIFVLNEFDLMKNFMPFMETSKEVKTVSRNCKIGHIVNDFPIISKRQAFFQGIGYDRMKHNNSILLFSRSLHNRQDLQKKLGYKVNTDSNAVQLQYKFFLVEYKPISRKHGKIKIAMNVDMKISAPKFILDPVSQNFGKDYLKNVLHVTKNFQGSQWEKSALHKTQFTNFIRGTINNYFPQ